MVEAIILSLILSVLTKKTWWIVPSIFNFLHEKGYYMANRNVDHSVL